MSPEILNNEDYNAKSDIWSIGCLLYEMMTYKCPFEAKNTLAQCRLVLEGKYEPVADLGYSQELQDMVALLLTVDQYTRPDINQILEHEHVVERKEKMISEQILVPGTLYEKLIRLNEYYTDGEERKTSDVRVKALAKMLQTSKVMPAFDALEPSAEE